ncbi:MAG: hypothetical protein HNEKOMLI_00251 [Sodalis sp. Psp]|nr:hypothetical protein [Sodalis sp. Psp]MCR3756748.1 hypothetical protein [Sodalis sp. Ppy]
MINQCAFNLVACRCSAFSIVTASRPDILIVDEVISAGDSRFQAKCFEGIADFKQQGTCYCWFRTVPTISSSTARPRVTFLKNGASARWVSEKCRQPLSDELFGNPSDDMEKDTTTGLSLTNQSDRFASRHSYRAEEYRWRQDGAEIIDFDIQSNNSKYYPSNIDSNSQVDFYVKVRFEQDFSSVVPGMLIKSLEGLFLYSTNLLFALKAESISRPRRAK